MANEELPPRGLRRVKSRACVQAKERDGSWGRDGWDGMIERDIDMLDSIR